MINPSPFPQSPFVSPFPQAPQIKVEKPQPREAGMPRYLNYLADLSGCGHWRIFMARASYKRYRCWYISLSNSDGI